MGSKLKNPLNLRGFYGKIYVLCLYKFIAESAACRQAEFRYSRFAQQTLILWWCDCLWVHDGFVQKGNVMENIDDKGTANTDRASTDAMNAEIKNLKDFNIQTLQSDGLVDIEKINVDKNLPVEERIREFVRQIKNPYFFRCGKLIVQVEYSDTGKSINDCLKEFIDSEIK